MQAYYTAPEQTLILVQLADGETLAGHAGPAELWVPKDDANAIYNDLVQQGVTIAAQLPDPPAATIVPETITNRQFYQALADPGFGQCTQQEALDAVSTGKLPQRINAYINSQSTDQQFPLKMLFIGSDLFHRHHPLVIQIAADFGWTEQTTDDLWRLGVTL